MDDVWVKQYCRQIALPEVDLAGQCRLQASRVLIVGAGGLGSTAALLLAGAGVGALELIDDDHVELSNLHRQIGHTRETVGEYKVESLANCIHARYPATEVTGEVQRFVLNEATVARVAAADVVLDCTDNFQARYALNKACLSAKKPLVSAAAIRLEGQLSTFDARQSESPCYACLYPPVAENTAQTCLSQGVLGPVPSVLASLQALEACRLLLEFPENLVGRVLLFDARDFSFRTLELSRDTQCPACGRSQA